MALKFFPGGEICPVADFAVIVDFLAEEWVAGE